MKAIRLKKTALVLCSLIRFFPSEVVFLKRHAFAWTGMSPDIYSTNLVAG
jgi:thiamine transporter ThiT